MEVKVIWVYDRKDARDRDMDFLLVPGSVAKAFPAYKLPLVLVHST